ncbi:MAG: YbbR-like domain-containing protein [Lentisphaerae bacterium]|nr:YbbR-like domain-containing protein [Lentisphaerota bacterium]
MPDLIKKLIFHNSGLKLLALLLAVASWLAIHETISFEVAIAEIPLQISTGRGWAVFHQSANAVTATFRGSQEDIRLIDPKQIKAVIDLRTNAVAGALEVTITPRMIQGVRGVRPVQIHPEHVRISLDHETEKMVPVKGRVAGKPFAGAVEAIICEPAAVSLRGPAQQLQQTEWLYTEPLDIEGRIEGFAKRCRVLPPSDTWSPQIEPAEVQVEVVIAEKMDSRLWKDVPLLAIGQPGVSLKVEITPTRVSVRATGTSAALEGLGAAAPQAFVDCVDLDSSLTYDLPVQVFLPPGCNVTAEADPPYAHVVPGH